MRRGILLDTGPLVALLDRNDAYHTWAAAQWDEIEPPLLTCEAVITEACHLLRRSAAGAQAVVDMLREGLLAVPFRLAEHVDPVHRLLEKYANVPMSLADACLVHMAEIYAEGTVITCDSDFRIYRKQNRQVVPLRLPPRP